MGQSLATNNDKPLALKFQHDDPASRGVPSFNKRTDNLLLSITVPKRTGRKRKRGSDEPFVESRITERRDVRYLLRSLSDNPEQHKVDVVGAVRSTHVWRAMPDYVYSTRGSSFLKDLQSNILSQDYGLLKQWSLPQTSGLTDTETIPPASFSTNSLPLNYTYRQNPAVRAVADPQTGQAALYNTSAPIKNPTYQCHYGDEKWPERPPAECRTLSELSENQRQLYQAMHDLFETRPIWTRRALLNNLPDDALVPMAKTILPYLAFAIRSGPWRDTVCKYGVDPRTDRSFRKYQSILILLTGRDRKDVRDCSWRGWHRSKDLTSHIFTGTQSNPFDGNVWQLCDMHDPDLKRLVDIPDIYIRHECEPRYFGWYCNGTIAKIRVTLKAKVDALIAGEAFDKVALDKFLMLPERWDGAAANTFNERTVDLMQEYLGNNAGKKELEWASAYRSLCRTQAGSLPTAGGSGKGRLSKSKPFTRPSFLETGESQMSEDPDSNAAAYEEPEEGDEGLSEREGEGKGEGMDEIEDEAAAEAGE